MGEILNLYRPVWMMNLPQDKELAKSKRYWLSEVRILKNRIEELTGKHISRNDLKDAILLLKERQDIIRRLTDIRKSGMPVISGRDMFLVIQSCFFDEINRWIKNAEGLCSELESNVKKRKFIISRKPARILVTGSPFIFPNFKIPDIIESLNAVISIDETCAGRSRGMEY